MEIKIGFDENGKFSVEKSDGMAIFTAIGMLELAKNIMFSDVQENSTVKEEVEEGEQITIEDLEKVD